MKINEQLSSYMVLDKNQDKYIYDKDITLKNAWRIFLDGYTQICIRDLHNLKLYYTVKG